jgi:hypothetical protein
MREEKGDVDSFGHVSQKTCPLALDSFFTYPSSRAKAPASRGAGFVHRFLAPTQVGVDQRAQAS